MFPINNAYTYQSIAFNLVLCFNYHNQVDLCINDCYATRSHFRF